MLVLSRKQNETLMIGDDIKITILDLRNGRVQIGVDAPRKIPVHRQEVYERCLLQNKKESQDE